MAGVGAGIFFTPTLSGCSVFTTRKPISNVDAVEFRNPLNIPPIATSESTGGKRVFDLVVQAGKCRLISSTETETWGVNGPFLAPTIRARRGEEIAIRVTNRLDEATTLHWHGMHLPAAADGGPHQMIEAGDTWLTGWTIDQPAATLWYHPHPHGQTERHVYKGLAGMFIVDDEAESALDLPRRYGVDDIPVIVQDKSFDEDGQLIESERRDNGMLGDTILVNGTFSPRFKVTSERTRLRLLNASSARFYAFGFSDGRAFDVIASDGGLLRERTSMTRIMLSPAERAEIIVELSGEENVTLRSYPQELGISDRLAERTGARDELDILLLEATSTLKPSPPVPLHLSGETDLDPGNVAETRAFELGDNRINGLRMDMDRIDAAIQVDTTEIWEVVNTHTQPHNFHVHDVQFQILDIDGSAPPPALAGWKDTVYTPPDVRFRLIMRFSRYTDPEVPYMYHCHLLWHEDQGMMGQFVVVDDPDVHLERLEMGGHNGHS